MNVEKGIRAPIQERFLRRTARLGGQIAEGHLPYWYNQVLQSSAPIELAGAVGGQFGYSVCPNPSQQTVQLPESVHPPREGVRADSGVGLFFSLPVLRRENRYRLPESIHARKQRKARRE